MNSCKPYIERITNELPEICYTRDLVKAKIFRNREMARRAREKNWGPAFLRLSPHEIIYPKEAVIEWLKERHYEPKDFQEGERS